MADGRHIENRFWPLNQSPIVWSQWNFAWRSSFSQWDR